MPSSDALEVVWRWLSAELNQEPVPPLLLVVGLEGGGLLEVLDAKAPNTRVLALEPDPVIWQNTVARRHVDVWRQAGRLTYLSGPAYAGADEAWRLFPATPDGYKLIVDPRLSTGSPANLDAARVMQRIVFGARANAEARRRFAPQYLSNVIQNLPALTAGHDIRTLTDAYKGVPGIVAAAGPSLDTAIEQLAGGPERGLLIAADTALRPLLTAGITPHLAVGVDPGPWNARHFHSLPDCARTWLVGESALDPSARVPFENRTFWFRVGDHHPWPWLKELGLDVRSLSVWGSVLTAAFQVAWLAGCDPIVIVGADLAYTGGRPYCRGTTYEFDWAALAASGSDLGSTWRAQLDRRKLRTVPDLHGKETASTESMQSFRDWMVGRAQRCGRRVINATGAGILFGEGIEQMSLSAAIPQPCEVKAVGSLVGVALDIDTQKVAADVNQIEQRLATGDRSTSPLVEWVEFCGKGFDSDAIAAVLGQASSALLLGEPRDVVRPSVAPDVSAPSIAQVMLTRLPEAHTRFRAALAGVPPPDAVASHMDASQRPEALREALRLLQSVCASAAGAAELTAMHDLTGNGYAISGAYSWPQATRWEVQAFEALLGLSWSSRVPGSEPFLVRPRRLAQFAELETNGSPKPMAEMACVALAEQWLRCVGGLETPDASVLRGQFARSLIAVDTIEESDATRARQMMGTLVSSTRVLAFPRVLTSEGLDRSIVEYANASGIVCVIPYSHESVVIGEEGQKEAHLSWPLPIVGELPWGPEGAVAWGNGLAKWPDKSVGPAYVMYRRTAADVVQVDEISVRPTMGAWWNDRVYFNCYSTPTDDSWAGLASWAPGEAIRRELPDVVLFGMLPAGNHLDLAPCEWISGQGYQRQRLHSQLQWRPDSDPVSVPASNRGVASSVAVGERWTATAFPESDTIQFAPADGESISMRCHFPIRVAWVGRALLVGSAEREMFLFPHLADALDEFGAHR